MSDLDYFFSGDASSLIETKPVKEQVSDRFTANYADMFSSSSSLDGLDSFLSEGQFQGNVVRTRASSNRDLMLLKSKFRDVGASVEDLGNGSYGIRFNASRLGRRTISGSLADFVRVIADSDEDLINVGDPMWDVEQMGANFFVIKRH